MANPTWPTSLPAPLNSSPSYAAAVEGVLRTSMETGAPKSRRRFTAVPETLTAQIMLNSVQWAALLAFKKTMLADVGPFDWVDFRTGDPLTYVFTKEPVSSFIKDSKGLWNVAIELMTVP